MLRFNSWKFLPLSLCLLSSYVSAGVIPGRWEKVGQLSPGRQLLLSLNSGARMEVAFKELGSDYLAVLNSSGAEVRFPRTEVKKITSADKKPDSTLDGTLVGLAAGFAIGFAGGAAIYHAAGGEKPELHEITLPAGGFGAGVGALVGGLSDRARHSVEVFYQAP